jgi:hypothetical protein
MRVAKEHFLRWRDEHAVVHWVTSRRNNKVFTECGLLIEHRSTRVGPDGFKATRLPPTCFFCTINAEDEVAGFREPD